MEESSNKLLNNDNLDEQLPFHYPLSLNNKNSDLCLFNRLDKKAFYYIYNEYNKKNINDIKNNIKIPKGNKIINIKNKISKNNFCSCFFKKYKFLRKRKNQTNYNISKSISIQKNSSFNNDYSFGFEDFFIDKSKLNNESFNNNEKDKKKFKRCISSYNPYKLRINLKYGNNNLFIPFGFLKNKNNRNSIKNKSENKNKSFIIRRNSKNKIFSSKSFFSNYKNSKLNTGFNTDENKYNNNNSLIDYMNKDKIYNKRMIKIDKFVKNINEENKSLHNSTFYKYKKRKDDSFINNKYNSIRIMKKKLLKNCINIFDEKNKNISNKILFNKYHTSKERKIERISDKTRKTKNNFNNSISRYNSKINIDDKENRSNIRKIIKYILKNQKLKVKESEKNNNNSHKKSEEKSKIIKINKNEQFNQICVDNEQNKKEKIKLKINRIPIAPNKLKQFKTIASVDHIILNNKFNENICNIAHNNKKKEENKNLTNEDKDYTKFFIEKNNSINNNERKNQNITYKFSTFDFEKRDLPKNKDMNRDLIGVKNKENKVKDNSFNIIFCNDINDNSNSINIRKYLNNYYVNKYNQKLNNNNSFNLIGDKYFSLKEDNYYNMLKNNLLQNLIKDESFDKENNNSYNNNISPNVNINININQNDFENKNIDINMNNSEKDDIKKEHKIENYEQNSLQLLTPSFTNEQGKKNQEQKTECTKKNTFKNNDINELQNYKNIIQLIPLDPENNNNKFSYFFDHNYTFKNKSVNYRNKLTKKNQIKLNNSNIDIHKNKNINENQKNNPAFYNINPQKRKEDLFQLFHFSQSLGSKDNKF